MFHCAPLSVNLKGGCDICCYQVCSVLFGKVTLAEVIDEVCGLVCLVF